MAKPKELLGPDDYRNYRDVRAVAILFVVLGSVFVVGGITAAVVEPPARDQQIPAAMAAGMAVVGLTGVGGGIAALRGNRRWAPLVYVMAALYILGFPLGTILSYVMLTGLARYLDSAERIRQAASEGA